MAYTPIAEGTEGWDVPLNAALVDQDARITTNATDINTVETRLSTLDWQASDHTLKGWSFDPCTTSGGATSVSGTMYLIKVPVREASTVSALVYTVSTAGATLTAGQNLAGLYSAAGVKLGESADLSTEWTSIGTKTTSLITPASVSAGFYFVALLSVGTTPPQFLRAGSASASATNYPSASMRRFSSTPGLTALPASFTPLSTSTDNNSRWVAVI